MPDPQRFEVELKFPLEDRRDEIVQRLRALGAVCGAVVEQTDRYFNHPVRDFAESDEALRIRSNGDNNVLTYKGPKIDTRTKTRPEIELPLGPATSTADQLADVLTRLSFRPVGIVKKQRQTWHFSRGEWEFEIALDDVANVGSYLEVELVCEQDRLTEAQTAVLSLSLELGLSEPERRSYLKLLLRRLSEGA